VYADFVFTFPLERRGIRFCMRIGVHEIAWRGWKLVIGSTINPTNRI